MAVDLNSDMGEGFGPWSMGDDDAMLEIVTSANVACGWHAGDPIIMHKTAETAKAKGVSIGAHPGFGDLWGFGRRTIRGDSMADLEKQIAYQIGAMQALAVMAGHKVTHVKTHGALGNMANDDADIAMAVGRAIKAVDSRLIYVVMPGLVTEHAAEKLGLLYVREVFADRTYDDSGNLTARKKPGPDIHDAALAAERVLRMVQDREIITVTGKRLKVEIDTICVHGDNPAAVAMARTVRTTLEAAGVKVQPFAR
ncbi:MAG: 5-oxoprolinase subunit PxpA [Alphaproteobacteria bacterium]